MQYASATVRLTTDHAFLVALVWLLTIMLTWLGWLNKYFDSAENAQPQDISPHGGRNSTQIP